MSISPPEPGGRAADQRRLDRRDRVDAGENVGEGDADLLRLAVGFAGQVHHPAHALDDEVVAGARRVGAVVAEAGDRAIDEARIERLQAGVVEPVLGEPAGLEILDQHVGARGEPAHDLAGPPGCSKSTASERLPRLQEWK